MPLPPEAAKLFHPKQKKGQLAKTKAASPAVSAAPSPTPPKPAPSPKPAPTAEEEAGFPPGNDYQEFSIVSSSLNGWKYDVMRFESRKPVDVTQWAQPVKLNRKDVRRGQPDVDDGDALPPVGVRPMLGADGKPVIGADGRTVMLDAEGKPIHNNMQPKDKQKGGPGGGRRKPGKKTRQVYKVADSVRELRKEERYPWVIEDGAGQEVWTAQMDEVAKSGNHGMLMPSGNNSFAFVPAHRWYRFQKKPAHAIPNLETAEKMMASITKNKDPERWLLRRTGKSQLDASTAAAFKQEPTDAGPSGGRPGLVVKDEPTDDLFGDDDEGGRRRRGNDMDADYDELPYEEEFQDDEEKVGLYEDDELTKEMEERLQKEYMTANKHRDENVVDDDDEPDAGPRVSKSMRKLVGKHEKSDLYGSDDSDENPYASEEEESSSDEEVVTNEPAVKAQPVPPRAGSQTPRPPTNGAVSRQTSPKPGSPTHGGHSILAQRATSPKPPRPKISTSGGSRATSPLATSPTSPNARSPSPTKALSPNGTTVANGKRKADDSPAEAAGGDTPQRKRRRPGAVAATVDANGNPIELKKEMVVEWLRGQEGVTTRDCIAYFTPFLRDPQSKDAFSQLVKEIASLQKQKGHSLYMKSGSHNNARTRQALKTDLAGLEEGMARV
ncbi:Rap30/74 interaction domain-containing protein [Peniophora sp. CONT]|nr:Rap30/74 interaction domain-containing protein [Peniophora sp. CONT]